MEFTRNDVILVNEQNEWLGTMEKLAAHKAGLLHRALSVFVLNNKGELLLQQRAEDKYHSGGLWSNTCCSHPIPHESTIAAAHRRLQEEMGFDCELQQIFTLTYKAEVGNGLTEYEYDHIYLGHYDGPIAPNAAEVKSYEFASLTDLQKRLSSHPEKFTPWLRIALPQFLESIAAKS